MEQGRVTGQPFTAIRVGFHVAMDPALELEDIVDSVGLWVVGR